MSGYKAAIRALREGYEFMDAGLRRQVDEQCATLEERARLSNAGRKSLTADKLRSKKTLVSLNESELARIVDAVGSDEELARSIRTLALKAADEIIASRGN